MPVSTPTTTATRRPAAPARSAAADPASPVRGAMSGVAVLVGGALRRAEALLLAGGQRTARRNAWDAVCENRRHALDRQDVPPAALPRAGLRATDLRATDLRSAERFGRVAHGGRGSRGAGKQAGAPVTLGTRHLRGHLTALESAAFSEAAVEAAGPAEAANPAKSAVHGTR